MKNIEFDHKEIALNRGGFSLIEVMIVAGLLAGLSLVAMHLLEEQKKISKDTQTRFEIEQITAQIARTLSNSNSCLKTFETVKIKELLKSDPNFTESIFDTLLKYNDKTEESSRIYELNASSKKSYNGIKIVKYEVLNRPPEVELNEDDVQGEVIFRISYDRGDGVYGNKILRKDLILNVNFSQDDKNELKNCSTAGFSGNSSGQIKILNPEIDKSLIDKSGTENCLAISKTCVAVVSQNFSTSSTGTNLSNLCNSNYNTGLVGVSQGSQISNFHSCDARLGTYQTYTITGNGFSLQCSGIFVAICN